jgi:hypothetical protein
MVHRTRLGILAVVVAIPLVPLCSFAQPAETWTDASSHTAQSVAVGDGIELDVLDCGGTGRAIVSAGLWNTAYVFAQVAPTLTDTNRVIGMTPRAMGCPAP